MVMMIAPGVFDTFILQGIPDEAPRRPAYILYPSRLGDPAEYAELAAHIAPTLYHQL
jgi:NAD(P)-dependent dehydrogenase (short-subunit alcohol dehydrogenase family)